ncbi:hypothetical protein [Longitalea arenae]|uniref:hypothetical protein n=1 Tax=Longitalea arenae TaxID=2812558 RepID=UPI001967493D|nr:hypothetical protein [Longitalea arenae]
MKNTLLAVLITTVCYDHIHAQRITPQVVSNAVSPGSLADGAASTDKLSSDIFSTHKLVDGVLTMNKLADDISHSETILDDVVMTGSQQRSPNILSRSSVVSELWSHAWQRQTLLLPIQIVQKPRPVNTKRTG